MLGPCVQVNMDVYASKWLRGLCASNTGKAYPSVDFLLARMPRSKERNICMISSVVVVRVLKSGIMLWNKK